MLEKGGMKQEDRTNVLELIMDASGRGVVSFIFSEHCNFEESTKLLTMH